MWRERASGLLSVAALLAVGCQPSDDEYFQVVEAYIKKGPIEACCAIPGGPSANCITEAKERCGFVESPDRFERISVERQPGFHANVASVTVRISGKNGNGECKYQVAESGSTLAVISGTCY